MVDITYRELRIIRPHTSTTIKIEVTAKCDSISDMIEYAKYLHMARESAYVVCDDILYFLNDKDYESYLITRVVNL